MTEVPRQDRIRRALHHLRQGSTDESESVVPFGPEQYHDPDIARRERVSVFGRVPSIACHTGELPEPGCFVDVRMPRNRALVVRQEDGSVRAFVNACRARGTLLEERSAGRRTSFSGFDDRWSYGIDGTPRGEVDGRYGLVRLPAEERHGLVWLVDDPAAGIDVAAWLGGEVDAMLAGYRLGSLYPFRPRASTSPPTGS